jgi:voltage-gated potassium channel Kch
MSASEHRSNWQWWFGALVAVAAFGFGAVGLWQYESSIENGVQPDILSIFYHTLQLFILHAPHLDHPLPWQLHVGRFLAAGFFFAAAAKAFQKIFRDEVLLIRLWLPRRHKHVVVCGLGNLGLRLALAARLHGHFVVAIEKHPSSDAVDQARAKGVLVLEGDVREPDQLRRTHIKRAEILVAACDEDSANVAVASIAGRLAQRWQTQITCHLWIRDDALRNLLSQEGLFTHEDSRYRVNSSDLELEATAARQAFRLYPLDFEPIHNDDDTLVHLIVIGFGKMGQRLVRQAARVGHFANEVGKSKKRLRITVVSDQPETTWSNFQLQVQNLGQVCDAEYLQRNPGDVGFAAAMAALGPTTRSENRLVTYAVSLNENEAQADYANLRLGLELSKITSQDATQVLIRQNSGTGYSSLFPTAGRGNALSDDIHAFGMEDDVFGWDEIFREDQIAQALHNKYLDENKDKKLPDWYNLRPEFKDSNRQAADHISIKLRAIGYESAKLRFRKRIKQFDHSQIDLLARMEHARWCAERYLAGWKYGKPTDPANKINECLVRWEELGENDKRKDWDQIVAIPKILKDAGLGIYPVENKK